MLERFHRDDDAVVRGVLHDLTESGLVFVSGSGQHATYRVATEEELAATQNDDRDADELVWVIVYRYGPLRREAIDEHLSLPVASLDTALERLVATGRVQRSDEGTAPTYSARELVVPLDATAGWEASVFDHYHALVQTICRKLGQEPRASGADTTGGSTYTFEVWSGHPYEESASTILRRFREEQSELRKLVQTYNDEHPAPIASKRVVVYAGQYVAEEETP